MIDLPTDRQFCLIIEGDCLAVLPLLAAGCVDLTICDPAYQSLERHRAVGTTTRLKNSKASSNPWFGIFPNSLYPKLFNELHRVHANNTHAYVFCDGETEHVILSGCNPYHNTTPQKYQPVATATKWRAWPSLTWLKTRQTLKPKELAGRVASLMEANCDEAQIAAHLAEQMTTTGMGYHWRRATEQILFLEKGKRKLNNLGWGSMLAGPRAPRKGSYPTQKPLCVLDKLICNSTDEKAAVLDCFAGSGHTGLAALNAGRSCILIDIKTEWMTTEINWPIEPILLRIGSGS